LASISSATRTSAFWARAFEKRGDVERDLKLRRLLSRAVHVDGSIRRFEAIVGLPEIQISCDSLAPKLK